MISAMSLGGVSISATVPSSLHNKKVTCIFTFLTLKEAKESTEVDTGSIIQTLGYYTLNDGGGSFYHIDKLHKGLEPNEGDVIQFQKGLIGTMIEDRPINYKMFGALGDGRNDDGIQIKIAHQYANRHKKPIFNYVGEYWIEETRNIPIQSTVNWGESVFHINERLNTKNAVFKVSSRYDTVEIRVDSETKEKIVSTIKPGMQVLPELKNYKNCLISIIDENDRIGFRAGADYSGHSWAREEFFYL